MNISLQVSIKRQLSQRFRNLRRSSYTAEGSKQSVAPTSASTTAVVITQESILPQEDYIKDIATIQKEWDKDKQGTIVLLSITFHRRREWINGQAESISDVLKTFPCFKSYDYVS